MGIRDEINGRSDDFSKLCSSNKVKELYAFGSSVTDQFDPASSDIDLLVDIDTSDPMEKGEALITLWDEFESFFKRKIDLLTNSSIKNPILRKNIDNTKILIYDGKRKKVLI